MKDLQKYNVELVPGEPIEKTKRRINFSKHKFYKQKINSQTF